jgi:endonuclease/exonuclease/phosphatase family metal-dependent hydrolase
MPGRIADERGWTAPRDAATMGNSKSVRKSFFASAFALQLFQFGFGIGEPVLDNADVHTIVGEPARVARFAPADVPLKVVSWNIAQGKRYELVRDTLKGLDADVYLLQEVDMGVRRSEHRQVARELAHDLGLNWIFAGEFQELGQGRYGGPAITGQAVLSRFVIDDPVALPFENQARWRWRLDPFQPRRGGRMALRAQSGGVLFYNAHIESARNDHFRHKQVDEMLYDHLLSARVDLPVVFAGDFNTGELPDDSPIVQCLLGEGFVDALGVPSLRQTSINHDQPLDWIFLRNAGSGGGRVIEVADASDHYPLEASIGVPTRALVAP